MRLRRCVFLLAAGAVGAGVAVAPAQHSAELHARMHGATAALEEAGESISGALGEVVALLDADPATDWSTVEIDALARHLRQMNALFTGALSVESSEVPGGVHHRISSPGGDADALAAAREMVPAHAAMMSSELGWKTEIELLPEAVSVTVTSDESAAAARLRALGFYGFMAAGGHHRRHHLMLARGAAPHRPTE